jgi:hypothetical protein
MNTSTIIVLAFFVTMQQPSDEELLQAVRNAYEANLANVSHGLLRFDYTVGSATDLDAARQDKWKRTAIAPGLLAIDGLQMRYEHTFSPEDTATNRKRIGERSWTSNLFSIRLLTNGVVTLSDRIQVTSDDKTIAHTSKIDSGVDLFQRFKALPLDIGLKSQGHDLITILLSNAVDGKVLLTGIRYDFSGDDGDRLVELIFDTPNAEILATFDLERGAVPRILRVTSNGRVTKWLQFDNVTRCGPDSWLPLRMLSYYEGGLVREVVIREASFDKSPARSVFQMEYPKPVPMLNTAESVSYEPRQVWRLDDLPSPGSKEAPRITIRSLADRPPPAPPGERESFFPYRSLGLFALGGVLIATASRIAIRRYHHG